MAQLLPASVLPVKPVQTAVIKSAPAKAATHKFAEKDGDGFRIALFVLCCLVCPSLLFALALIAVGGLHSGRRKWSFRGVLFSLLFLIAIVAWLAAILYLLHGAVLLALLIYGIIAGAGSLSVLIGLWVGPAYAGPIP
jgi:hypothetical protein